MKKRNKNKRKSVFLSGGKSRKSVETKKTYDVVFDRGDSNDREGFHNKSIEFCKEYIRKNNGRYYSYFKYYIGYLVGIVCNETGECVYEEKVRQITLKQNT